MATVENVETIENAKIPAALRAALCVIPRKTMKTILGCARVRAGGHGVEISANNLDFGFRATLPTNERGAVADIAIPRAAVETWAKAGVESIVAESCAAAAAGIRAPVECGMELPTVDIPDNPTAAYTLPFATFAAVEKHIGAATDSDSSRYALGGIFIESGAGCVRFVGTDGRRLHVYRAAGASDGAFHHVIPAYAFAAAAKAIGHTIDERGAAKKRTVAALSVRIVVDDSSGRGAFLWTIGNCEFAFSWRSIEGRFPRYRDVFPEWLESGGGLCGWTNAADILAQSETCRKTVCTENSKGIDIRGPGAGHDCRIEARSAERGEYMRKLAAYLPIGWHRKLDPAFVADTIRAAVEFSGGAETVDIFGTMESDAPAFFGRPESIFAENAGAAFAAVIMPLAAD